MRTRCPPTFPCTLLRLRSDDHGNDLSQCIGSDPHRSTHPNIPVAQMADATRPPMDFPTFMGGCIMAMNVSLVLYGVSTTQAYIYALHSKKDSSSLKALVAAVWVLETLHTVCIFHEIYFYTIGGFGDFEKMGMISWSAGVFLAAETAVVALVQGFYIRRIWLLSSKRVLPTMILSFLLATSVGFHSAGVAYIFIFHTWVEYLSRPAVVLTAEVANALFAAVDGLIAFGMIYYLHHHRTGFKRSDGVIRWIMGYVVNTGALTMLAAVTGIVTLATYHRGIVAVGVSTIVSKLYANALLGFLNARGFMRAKRQKIASQSVFDSVGIQLSRLQEGMVQRSMEMESVHNSAKASNLPVINSELISNNIHD
ncbi:hypothetical protein QCA50_007777 [Cerrena zonata]|uniref:DUF6534 domain-containing protein n=1 Tax=Cerrena zonata TaxID=2478898 RepID=A0AAW0GI17_9APHY